MKKVKACWWCKHFAYINGYEGCSEYTPGHQFEMLCGHNKWNFKAETTSQEDFGRMLQTAEDCQHFEVIPSDVESLKAVAEKSREEILRDVQVICKMMIDDIRNDK